MKVSDLQKLLQERGLSRIGRKEQLVERLSGFDKSAREAHAEATHEQNKAENKYDTRGAR
jgi:hypothetical protein